CIPYMLLKPITSKLSAQRWFATSVKKNTGKYATLLAKRLEQSRIPLSVRLGSAKMSVDEVLDLQVGDVVLLNRTQNEEVEILIGEQVKFRGRPGIKGKKLAVHINRYGTDPERDELMNRKGRHSKH
ncbi:MAG: FliM/FliN family flagellar motor switch protein, partial [Chthonomonadaceae bacterium]|nr:FliM/FliN family flagellar motor switch protein [Chthonomonadaceae bacterium]